jgi:hypothetical protein
MVTTHLFKHIYLHADLMDKRQIIESENMKKDRQNRQDNQDTICNIITRNQKQTAVR